MFVKRWASNSFALLTQKLNRAFKGWFAYKRRLAKVSSDDAMFNRFLHAPNLKKDPGFEDYESALSTRMIEHYEQNPVKPGDKTSRVLEEYEMDKMVSVQWQKYLAFPLTYDGSYALMHAAWEVLAVGTGWRANERWSKLKVTEILFKNDLKWGDYIELDNNKHREKARQHKKAKAKGEKKRSDHVIYADMRMRNGLNPYEIVVTFLNSLPEGYKGRVFLRPHRGGAVPRRKANGETYIERFNPIEPVGPNKIGKWAKD